MSERCGQPTAAGTPCRHYVMTGADRCAAHLGLVGRPTLLTEEVVERLTVMLRAGNYLHVAISAAGISRATFGTWMQRGTSKRASDAPYVDLRKRVETARAEGEVRMVTVIARAAQNGDWRAALVLLEREFPERWGPVGVRMRDEGPPAPAEPVDEPLPGDDLFREVDELAERRRTRAG